MRGESRRAQALVFAAVGAIAAAAHVSFTDASDVRLWRETVPLACLVGAGAGGLFRPRGWLAGALVAGLAVPAFALAYGLAETAILARRGEIGDLASAASSIMRWAGVVLEKAAIGAAVATITGGVAGLMLGHKRSRSD